MSDILVVLSSESWMMLKALADKNGWTLDVKTWGDGRGPSLVHFLDKNLSEMAYDENVHIITKVKSVELETRCPYPRHKHRPGRSALKP